MTDDQRQFLLSFKARHPQWNLLGIEGADKLPAVRWKLHNLERMPEERHRRVYENLERVLADGPASKNNMDA
ncbi:hypothetical protein [Mesorhizobium carmichaelinearum]|uniref:hypothetical protein n=1 Tax=Mesorhizobium carmichaelinearum TaxID=1208188 RepID=UPI0015CBFF9C|nr:hypothetical protein [Mesorhizobium carmichaelinearum]